MYYFPPPERNSLCNEKRVGMNVGSQEKVVGALGHGYLHPGHLGVQRGEEGVVFVAVLHGPFKSFKRFFIATELDNYFHMHCYLRNISYSQSWALSVFFNFFNNKK